MGRAIYLTKKQWEEIEPHLPKLSSRGRPWRNNKECLEGILWILRTGARWKDLPDRYPSPSTCWRRLKYMDRPGYLVNDMAGVSFRAGRATTNQLERIFPGRNVLPGQKRGLCVGKTKRGKGTKLMVLGDGKGIPLGVSVHSASPAEVKLAKETLEAACLRGKSPDRLIADKAYDSDHFRDNLWDMGIEQVTPHRGNRVKVSRQDGRALRRYKLRWKIERSIAWIGNFRRLVVRWDRNIEIFRAFLHLACLIIVCRYL